MNKSGIRSPLIRLFALFYGNLGLQLCPIEWSNIASLLNLCLNVFFNVLVLVVLHTLDPFYLAHMINKYAQYKPLLAFFLKIGFEYSQPASYLFSMAYFMVYGPRIVRLLDSECFYECFQSPFKSWIIFLLVTLANSFFFVVFILTKSIRQNLIEEVLVDFIVFLLHLNFYASLNVVFYYQYATNQQLVQIERKLSTKVLMLEEDWALLDIQTLAAVNRQLNHFTSLPLAIYLFSTVYNQILFFCLTLFEGLNFGLMVHIVFDAVYLLYLISLNNRLLHTLSVIFTHLKRLYEPNQFEQKSSVHGIVNHWHATVMIESKQSRLIRFSEIDHLYHDHFAIQVFHLMSVNLPFLFHAVLFILNYVVFITQTN